MDPLREFASLPERSGRRPSPALAVSIGLHAVAAALLVTAPGFVLDGLPEPGPAARAIPSWPVPRPIAQAVTPPAVPGPVRLRRNQGGAPPGRPLHAPMLPQPLPSVPVEDLQADVPFDPPPIGGCIGDGIAGDGSGVRAGSVDPSGSEESRGALRPGGNVQAPVKLHHVSPVYPDLARRAGIEGVVVIECFISPRGRVADARVLAGHPLLQAAALDAVRQWVYRPTLLNDVPVAVVLTVTVRFQLRR